MDRTLTVTYTTRSGNTGCKTLEARELPGFLKTLSQLRCTINNIS